MGARSFPALLLCAAAIAACSHVATLPFSAGVGPDPQLPPASKELIPTVAIAPAKGWPQGATPRAAQGLKVSAFATGLEHPRWLYVLPNGDVLVAETNAPERPDETRGVRGKAMEIIMKRAGAGVPSPDRITLLHDADGDGVAEPRSVFIDKLNAPFGMALAGNDLYVANTDAIVRLRIHRALRKCRARARS